MTEIPSGNNESLKGYRSFSIILILQYIYIYISAGHELQFVIAINLKIFFRLIIINPKFFVRCNTYVTHYGHFFFSFVFHFNFLYFFLTTGAFIYLSFLIILFGMKKKSLNSLFNFIILHKI